jgi:hypothetical protein
MIGNETRMMGVGCFAGPPTLARVLDRLLKAYSLGDWRDAFGSEEKGSRGCPALRSLIHANFRHGELNGEEEPPEKIAGFFLGCENQRLNLSVFIRRRGKPHLKSTTSLGELSRLRRSRLH